MSLFLATVYDRFLKPTEDACLNAWRRELIRPVRGRVLEIGAGTGLNLEHYHRELDELILVEPDRHMRKHLQRRLRRNPLGFPHRVVDTRGEDLPYEAGSFDVVVSALILCSVPNPATLLREVRRVLKVGGTLVFLEHVAASDNPRRLRWQQWIEPVWRRIADDCHLTRDSAREIESAGFAIESCIRASARKALPFLRPSIRGIARRIESTSGMHILPGTDGGTPVSNV